MPEEKERREQEREARHSVDGSRFSPPQDKRRMFGLDADAFGDGHHGGVSLRVLKRRQAVERWKEKNRDRYLEQKRRLAARPEYRAHRREMYRQQVDELAELGILPRPKGRPRLYEGAEALEMRRERARRASARYRLKKISQSTEKDEQSTSTDPSENSA